MRKIRILFMAFIGLGVVLACNPDDFLEETPNAGRQLGELVNLKNISSVLSGSYWQMMIGRNENAFNNPVSIYQQWNALASDGFSITDETVVGYDNLDNSYFTYNRILDHLQEDTYERLYSICYTVISNLNQAIELIEDPSDELIAEQLNDTKRYNQLVGEVYALRGFNYFLLSQVFGPKFVPGGDNSSLSLILKNRNSAEFEDIFATRSTVSEVYDFIIRDYESALEHISNEKLVGRLNKSAVHGLLSRLYLDMNDWEKADENATLAMNGFSLEIRPIDAFNKTDLNSSNGVIFEMQCSIGHNWDAPNKDLIYIGNNTPIRLSQWNWIERRTMGQAIFLGANFTVDNINLRTYAISHEIMKKMGWMTSITNLTNEALSDLRFQQVYHWAPGNTDTRMDPVTTQRPQDNYLWVFKDARSEADNVLDGNNFTYELYDGRAHLPVLRISEMYLTRAISRLKIGDTSGALSDLNALKQSRWDTSFGNFIPFSGSDTQIETEIEMERARELLGEGDRLFYLKAMQYDIPAGDRGTGVIPFPYTELFWDLPPEETAINPNVD